LLCQWPNAALLPKEMDIFLLQHHFGFQHLYGVGSTNGRTYLRRSNWLYLIGAGGGLFNVLSLYAI